MSDAVRLISISRGYDPRDFALVAFGGAGETRTTRQTFAATQNVGSGGVGFRYLLASKFGMHAGIDVAHSSGTTAFYIVVGSAWFRP